MALRVELGLPPPEPTYHPLGLKNSAIFFREATESKILTDPEKDLDSLIQFGKQNPTNLRKDPTSIQTYPDTVYGPTSSRPHLDYKIYPQGRTVHWGNPHNQILPELGSQAFENLPFQEGPSLPSPCREEEDTKDFS